jgi:hypothetical protein
VAILIWQPGVLSRVKAFKVPGFEVDLEGIVAKASERVDVAVLEDRDSTDEPEGLGEPGDIDDLQLTLDRQLAYVAKVLLPANERTATGKDPVPFATIGSLERDGYLDRSQALVALRVQTFSGPDLAQLSVETRMKFLRVASRVINNFRFQVFKGVVKVALTEQLHREVGPLTTEKEPGMLVTTSKDADVSAVVWPTLALSARSALATRAKTRALKKSDGRRLILVVPNNSRLESLTQPESNPAVVKLEDLAAALEAAPSG